MSAVALVTTRYVDEGHDEEYQAWASKMESVLGSVPGFVSLAATFEMSKTCV